MKRTKQAAAVFTALALAATMAVPVWVTVPESSMISSETTDQKATCQVNGTYNVEKVYCLEIEWSDMNFTYEPGKWKASTDSKSGKEVLGYESEDNKAVGWNNVTIESPSGNGQTAQTSRYIKVTNKSNANVKVNFGFEPITNEEKRLKGEFWVGNTDVNDNNNGIWMQRADANVDGIHMTAGGTDGAHGTEKTGIATEAVIDFYMTGRPMRKYETESKMGDIVVTLTDAGDEDPASGGYGAIYKQSTT